MLIAHDDLRVLYKLLHEQQCEIAAMQRRLLEAEAVRKQREGDNRDSVGADAPRLCRD